LAGFEAQSDNVKLLTGEGTGFTYSRLIEISYAQNQFSSSSKTTSNSYSYYGQFNYSYKNKYYVIASSRYDASSVFGPDVQSSINSAAGIGWNISKEKLLRNVSWINLLRVRTSYGTTGNSRIGGYQAKGIYTFNNTGYNGGTSSYPSSAPNPSLSWEKGYKLNIGLDLNFLNRFVFTAEVYQNILRDAISSINTPLVNGFSSVIVNTADMRNQGIDIGLQAQLLKGKFNWTSQINFGYNKNIVLSVKDNGLQYSDNLTATVLQPNVSTSAIWGFKYAGADPSTGSPLYYDKSGTVKTFVSSDRVMSKAYQIGDRLPKAQGGFINTFNYKGLKVAVNLVYNIGGETLIDYNVEADGNNLTNRNGSVNLMDRWQKPGDITNIAKLSFTIPVVNSTKYMYDNTYIKLSNISVNYTLPKKLQIK